MRIAGILFAVVVSATCAEASASKPEVRGEISSRDAVRATLRERGISLGFDADRGRIVAIGTHGFSLKGDDKDDELELTETYDFPDDANDDFETKRFKAVWKAYADGLADIATLVGSSMNDTETKDKDGKVASRTTKMATSLSLDGVATIEMCESLTADGEYEVTVAVCQSNKRREMYSRGVAGGAARPGKHTIAEFVEQKSNSGSGMICPQSYCDNEGVWWRIAGVPVDLSAGRNSKRVAVSTEKAKRYAYEAAIRTIVVGVSETKSVSSFHTRIGGDERILEKLSRTVTIAPMNTVLPVDSSKIKFLELDRMNPMTGKPVRCVVAALRPWKAIAGLDRKIDAGSGSSRNGTAMEQAKAYLVQKGWRLGREFLKSRRFAVAIGGAAFKYAPSMDCVVFAQKRNDAIRQALMETMMNIAFTYGCRGDLKMSLSAEGNTMQQTHVDDEACEMIVQDGVSFCDDSDSAVDFQKQDFKWRARFSSLFAESSETKRASVKKVQGRASSEMPIHGLKVERQFESIADGVYQIAFVATCDPKRGRDMALSFADEKSRDERGKLPLGPWVAEQDFGMVAGPRQYVDDKGNVWMIGIAPAAEGCMPFGSSLDGMAREYAAFGLSGDVKVSYEMSSLNGPSGEYSERRAVVLYDAESSPTGKNYPKEFEFVFHRPFTHPLTGRKGEVSICALRSGTKGFADKLTVEQIKENRARIKEQKRKETIRDALLKSEDGKGNENQ